MILKAKTTSLIGTKILIFSKTILLNVREFIDKEIRWRYVSMGDLFTFI